MHISYKSKWLHSCLTSNVLCNIMDTCSTWNSKSYSNANSSIYRLRRCYHVLRSDEFHLRSGGLHPLSGAGIKSGCPLVLESHRLLEDHFPGLESHGKQQRSWKVFENADNVMEILQLHWEILEQQWKQKLKNSE